MVAGNCSHCGAASRKRFAIGVAANAAAHAVVAIAREWWTVLF